MNIQELVKIYAGLPQVKALAQAIGKSSAKSIFLEGLLGSSAPMVFGGLVSKCRNPLLFILQDAEEAGYFYHDLTQLLGNRDVLFFPSSYRRAIKYAQKDSANEILRTEVLARLAQRGQSSLCYVVTYPEAVSELVVSKKNLDARTLVLEKDQTIAVSAIGKTLREFGFREVDYVYEPGQFALRGSILDVYSYSCEYPFRIDFFGDDIDSIRTFEVEDQLSKDRRDRIEIVPELSTVAEEKVSFLSFLPKETLLVVKDYLYVRDAVERIYQEGFSSQARLEMEGTTELEQHEIERQLRRESQLLSGSQWMSDASRFRRIEFGHRSSSRAEASLHFNITVQPLFHKNFDLLAKSFEDYLSRGYQIFICADSQKQNERLRDILMPPESGGDRGLNKGKSFASSDPQPPNLGGLCYVDDCALESDIEMLFPDQYVPNDSERMLLYRELDNLANRNDLEAALEAYRNRLRDRFGEIPEVAEELIRVVPLRVLGKRLGIEKIMLKQQKMFLFFVSNLDSPYYQSDIFGRVLHYVTHHVHRCGLREANGKRSMVVSEITSVNDALTICREILTD